MTARKFFHPLTEFTLKLFEHEDVLDVTVLAAHLGQPSGPPNGRAAYRIVAADVLLVMHANGLLQQHGMVNPRKPEAGGHWYELVHGVTEAGAAS